MNHRIIGWFGAAAWLMGSIAGVHAQDAREKATADVRIGIYDNRAIALAYAASRFNLITEKRAAYEEAQERGDAAAMKEIETWGQTHQWMLHFQKSCRVPVDDLLEPVRDGIVALIESERLVAVTMMCDFTATGVELVDVTEQLVALYEPTDEISQAATSIRSVDPVALTVLANAPANDAETSADSQTHTTSMEPTPLDMMAVEREVAESYAIARPGVREYVRWTAGTFGKRGMWINQDAFAHLTDEQREQKVIYLATVLEESEYGRHLGRALTEASALQDERLVPGLMKVAGYHRDDADYDCRPKWMAVAALSRQESDAAVPMLIGLTDHGNQNTRMWAQAALSRKTGQDFAEDKPAWADWWQAQGHEAVDAAYLEAWVMPTQ